MLRILGAIALIALTAAFFVVTLTFIKVRDLETSVDLQKLLIGELTKDIISLEGGQCPKWSGNRLNQMQVQVDSLTEGRAKQLLDEHLDRITERIQKLEQHD